MQEAKVLDGIYIVNLVRTTKLIIKRYLFLFYFFCRFVYFLKYVLGDSLVIPLHFAQYNVVKIDRRQRFMR